MTYIDDPDTQRANKKFIRVSMQEPLLSREREFELAYKWRKNKDVKALHSLVQSYTRLVITHAVRFKNYRMSMGDLVQEGNIGLMQAALRFEPNREVRFSTYAGWWIRSSMQDYILRNWSIVRIGTKAAHKSLFFNFRRLCAQIQAKTSEDVLKDSDRREIARQLDVSLEDVETMELRLSKSDQSLNVPIGDNEDNYRQNHLVDESPTPEEQVMYIHDTEIRTRWLTEAIEQLNEREKMIIRQRRLQSSSDTLDLLGQKLGVSKERIRQLEKRALQKLRVTLTKRAKSQKLL